MAVHTNRRGFLKGAALAGAGVLAGAGRAPANDGSGAPRPWSADEIAGRLGISMAVYQKVRIGAREVAAIRRSGISRVELAQIPSTFDFRDRAQRAEVLKACEEEGVAVVSIHANLKLPFEAEDAAARAAAVAETLETLQFAEDAGATAVVAHLGRSERSKSVAVELLERSVGLRVRLTTENMSGGVEPYAALVDAVGSERFGLTVDIGHARDADRVNPFVKKGRARPILAACKGRVFHVHLHETFKLEQKPDHRPPLHPEGTIEWGEVLGGLRDAAYEGPLLFEDGRGEDPEEWTRMTAAFPRGFVARYGK